MSENVFEVGCRVRPRGADLTGELIEFNAGATGALIYWDNGHEAWKALRNLEVVPTQPPETLKTGGGHE